MPNRSLISVDDSHPGSSSSIRPFASLSRPSPHSGWAASLPHRYPLLTRNPGRMHRQAHHRRCPCHQHIEARSCYHPFRQPDRPSRWSAHHYLSGRCTEVHFGDHCPINIEIILPGRRGGIIGRSQPELACRPQESRHCRGVWIIPTPTRNHEGLRKQHE